ncbi:uncharacterized protein LOC116343545 [Contarinia nasturtii]|uniref:uncharacterized protein LOC116343545 n=1 Tax=Contarinia nasturtii TaxID=265458 RepID=UPI0012D3DE74|nr:uncharacterized protein LOC116343545 [Contarinia nasturtii]XP_031627523.1 uncharacterized protein LOC116343545 [Contarinia nasturtii]XP_031627524.1 uncharacterized protein LOC116343545 [Contarinia nasturtii]XP_031627525.1 uncharacterized protein LOC116343545 [Contarinia nasturtii]XP_031627527.1 uncharacterized protein LOC116343545 [Contarinia nasturtii]
MLSYMVPVEDKSPPHNLKLELNLDQSENANQNGNNNVAASSSLSPSAKILNFERQHHFTSALKSPPKPKTEAAAQRPKTLAKPKQQIHNMDTTNGPAESTSSILATASVSGDPSTDDGKKVKMAKIGTTKTAALKRVSFGSSKGSMVETLVFETPTPLLEQQEFGFPADKPATHGAAGHSSNSSSGLDDSGIELQEELERSKVRVTFFQSDKPQLISPPEPQHSDYFSTDPNSILVNFSDEMASQAALPPNYNRQISTESGWDNPFRPGGDLSREADEIVNMIKGGKPITPNDVTDSLSNGHTTENGAVVETVTKTEAPQKLQSPKNGSGKDADQNGAQNTQISNSVVPGPQSASHVVVDDKKKKKCTCCVIQ